MEAILGFEPFGFIAGVMTKPFYVWAVIDGQKVCIQLPTIPNTDPSSKTTIAYNPSHRLVAKETIEEVMADFDNEGFVMPDQDTWDFPEKPLRIKLSDSDITDLLTTTPEFIGYIDLMKDTTVKRNGNRYIYLSEVYPEHKALLSKYSSYSLDERK